MKNAIWLDIIKANPIFSSPDFADNCKKWEILRDQAEKMGLEPDDQIDFIRAGMTMQDQYGLRYEHIEPGEKIKAYDFQPMPFRPESFVLGVVLRHEDLPRGKFLVIRCEEDQPSQRRIGQEIWVPMEMVFEFDGRVTIV